MCGCMRVYAYLLGRLNQRTLLDQHSHRIHVTVRTRQHQRCHTALPHDASDGSCVCVHVPYVRD